MSFQNVLKNTQHAAALVVFISFLALATALVAQFGFGLKPCVLCVYQRIPYIFAIAFGLMSYGAAKQDKNISLAFLAVSGIIFVIGMGIAAFHVGVEHGWWSGTGECGGSLSADMSLEDLRLQVLSAPIVRCDEAAWTLFGISMAGYNALLSLGLAIYTFAAVKKGLEHDKKTQSAG